ncbi:MAG: hypothetical protein PHI12_10715 [Dehalococcoidales bacterium]|nr:hypothetical protein [Dehalococcoidales bacterium]
MTDFEKIIKITRMAKEDARRTQENSKELAEKLGEKSILATVAGLGMVFVHIQDIGEIFPDVRQYVIAAKWYNTVFQMRMER